MQYNGARMLYMYMYQCILWNFPSSPSNSTNNGQLSTSIRTKRLRPGQHHHIDGAVRQDAPAELRAAGGAREDHKEPAGEAQNDDGPDELTGDQGTAGRLGGGSEESA